MVAAVKTVNEGFLVKKPFESLKEAYDIIKRLEERFKTIGFEVGYETESDAQRRLSQHQTDAVL